MAAANIPAKKSVPYIEILKQAGQLVWQNRFLFWFGLLMALGSPGSFNLGRSNNEFGSQQESARNFFATHWQITIIVTIILLILGVFLFLLSLVARAGLVKSVSLVARNKKTNFKEGWHTGKKYLGKLFGISLLFFLVIFILVIVLAIPVIFLIAAKSWVSAVLVGILAIAIFIPLIFIFAITKIFAEFYVILSDLRIRGAIETGYDLLIKNIANSIIFSLLLLAVSIVAGIILLPIAGIALVVLIPSGVAFYLLSKVAFAIFLVFAILLFLAAILFVSSIFQTYKTTAWTLFFQEIARVEKTEPEKIAEIELEKSIAATPEKI